MDVRKRVDRTTLPCEKRYSGALGGRPEPALTILYHPDPARVGDRAILHGLPAGRRVDLSRHEPAFVRPAGGAQTGSGLDEPHVSRRPVRLWLEEDGTVCLDPGALGALVVHRGQPAQRTLRCPAAAIRRGVVLTLADRVVLLLHEVTPLHDTLQGTTPSFVDTGLVGESDSLQKTLWELSCETDRDGLVCILGESGTGKDLVAQALHRLGKRKNGPFVAVNLGAVPPELCAADLFGSVKGAFTGAEDRPGLFEQADGGTLFLDEIGEAPRGVQVALLRALETGEIQRIGDRRTRRPDVRIVAATDADLEARVAAGDFRAALLNRLSGCQLHLPALRERRDDIGRLLIHFLGKELEQTGESHRLRPGETPDEPWLPASLAARMAEHDWPDNVRGLRHAVARIVAVSRGRAHVVLPADVARKLAGGGASDPAMPREAPAPPPKLSTPRKRTEAEIAAALAAAGGNVSKAARALAVNRTALIEHIRRSRSAAVMSG